MFPTVDINLEKIRLNTFFLKQHSPGLTLAAVTKGCGGDINVAKAMLTGGADQLADSRLARLQRLRQHFPATHLLMLRQPQREEMDAVVSLNLTVAVSCQAAAAALAQAAAKQNRVLNILLMLEVGSLREGLLPEEALSLAFFLQQQTHLKIFGLAANVGCYQGKMPDETVFNLLKKVSVDLKKAGLQFTYISGGNSSLLSYLVKNRLPAFINHARIGEAILLGVDTATNKPISGLATDAFTVTAEVIESKSKSGYHNHVVALGRQEIGSGTLKPLNSGEITNITSDHLVIKASEVLAVTGQTVQFAPDYFALMSLMESAYVKKRYI